MNTTIRYLAKSCILFSLFLSAASNAETCIANMREYQEKKSEFPPVFQKLPVMLVADSMLVTAGVKIRDAGGKIKLEGHVWEPGDIYSDNSYVKKLCFDGSTFKVTLQNSKSYNVSINGNSLKIKGISFKKSSPAGFASVVNEIQSAQEKSEGKKNAEGVQ